MFGAAMGLKPESVATMGTRSPSAGKSTRSAFAIGWLDGVVVVDSKRGGLCEVDWVACQRLLSPTGDPEIAVVVCWFVGVPLALPVSLILEMSTFEGSVCVCIATDCGCG